MHLVTRSRWLPNLFRITPKPVIEHCPYQGCRFAASALTIGRVDRAIAAHLVKAHHVGRKERES